jgi:glycine C-acetyltransferase/8-amino-7-oxononanoate synthase
VYTALEIELRAYFGAGQVLYFASGYLGAVILSQALQQEYERVFVDESSHFSILDAARAAGKPVHSYAHLDPADLHAALRRELRTGERPLILSDGVFPISGEIAPLPEILAAAEMYSGWAAIDDAHAAGVLGGQGRGTPDHFRVNSARLVTSATLSKALGGFGGVIPAPDGLVTMIERFSRVSVAASPPPLPSAAAAARALSSARRQPELRETLWQNVAHARAGLRRLGWPLAETPVPILCLGVRPGIDLARLKNELFARDICVAHVTSYSSTPPGGALRIAITTVHSIEQIDRLVAAIGALL